MSLLGLLVLVLGLVVVFWLLATYVVPVLPQPLGKVLLAVVAILMVVWLLGLFFGWGWTGHRVVFK